MWAEARHLERRRRAAGEELEHCCVGGGRKQSSEEAAGAWKWRRPGEPSSNVCKHEYVHKQGACRSERRGASEAARRREWRRERRQRGVERHPLMTKAHSSIAPPAALSLPRRVVPRRPVHTSPLALRNHHPDNAAVSITCADFAEFPYRPHALMEACRSPAAKSRTSRISRQPHQHKHTTLDECLDSL